jgi:hypothetical protein
VQLLKPPLLVRVPQIREQEVLAQLLTLITNMRVLEVPLVGILKPLFYHHPQLIHMRLEQEELLVQVGRKTAALAVLELSLLWSFIYEQIRNC